MKIVRSIAFLILMGTALDHRCFASEMEVDTPADCSNKDQIVWQRVKIKFDRKKFLSDCNREFPESSAKEFNNRQNDENYLNDLCWKVLFELKDIYKEKHDDQNYTFTYQSMAKFLLAHGVFPKNYTSAEHKKRFSSKLLTQIGRNITPQCKQRWPPNFGQCVKL